MRQVLLALVVASLVGSLDDPQALRLRLRTTAIPPPPPSGGGGFAGGYYSTNFALTENPISESSVWTNGGTTGLDWQNVQTGCSSPCTGPNRAYGIAESGQPPYDDPTAILKGTWSGTQWASGTAFVTNQGSAAGTQEIELHLLTTVTAHSITGYEILFSADPTDPYCQLVRWNGAIGNFTLIDATAMPSALVTGDVMAVSVSGGVFKIWKNGTPIVMSDMTDAVYTTGNPGIGFWKHGATAAMSDAGWSDFTASDGELFVATSGSQANVATAVTAATTGSTVLIPPGTSTWTAGITLNKGIHLKGSGAGHVEGASTTTRTPGTSPCNVSGSCAFTIASNSTIRGWKVGETVTAQWKPNGPANNITGTVASWNGTTLTLTVTAVTGSTPRAAWTFSTDGATIIRHNFGSGALVAVTEPTTQSAELSDIHFNQNGGTGDFITIASGGASGKATLVHDMRCQVGNSAGRCFDITVNRGVVWRFYGDCGFAWMSGSNNECIGVGGAAFKNPDPTNASWTTVSTMGMNDSGGTHNFYFEDSYFEGLTQTTFDLDDNSRTVLRHIVFDNSQIGSHGQETSNSGVRHFEIYNNLWISDNLGNNTPAQSANQNAALFLRGGTGVFADNVVPDIGNSEWGAKPELKFIALALGRNNASSGIGNLGYACWGNGTSTYSNHGSDTRPYPRQIGYGFVTGSGATDANLGYRGDSEPMYLWGNTGGLAAPQISSGVDGTFPCDGVVALSSDYIRDGTEYLWTTSATQNKSSYTKYTYPHPLRGAR